MSRFAGCYGAGRPIAALAWLACADWLAACAGVPALPPPDSGPRTHAVRIVSNGWHTSIVVPRRELVVTGSVPEAADFPDAAFLEFGWGDRAYYPAQEKRLGVTLGAAFTATPAVMHMAGGARAPERTYADQEVVFLALSENGFRHLVGAIADDFKRADGGRATPISRGLYPDSYFYDARGTFHLFNTCNTWTARMLRSAGIDLSPSGVITADELMARLRAAIGSDEPSGGLAEPAAPPPR